MLISFAVALGSVVLNWGRNLDISRPGDACSGVAIKLRNIADAEVCYAGSGSSTYINFVIDNIGGIDVDGLGIWITGEKGTKLLDLNNLSIKKGQLLDIKDKSIVYDSSTYGAIKNIQFFPKVMGIDTLEICSGNSVKANKIKAC